MEFSYEYWHIPHFNPYLIASAILILKAHFANFHDLIDCHVNPRVVLLRVSCPWYMDIGHAASQQIFFVTKDTIRKIPKTLSMLDQLSPVSWCEVWVVSAWC